MLAHFGRAGFMLGAIGIVCAVSSGAGAQDVRPANALLESGLYLQQAEVEAVFARLDADRPAGEKPIPLTATFWESGRVGYGQAERRGRMGLGGDATQMRFGADKEVRSGLVVGAAAAVGFGGLGSGDLGAQTFGRHADLYARLGGKGLFAKGDLGASAFSFTNIGRGPADLRSHADATGYGARLGGQIGAGLDVCGFRFTPTIALATTGHALMGYSERGGDAGVFAGRQAAAATGTVRLAGARTVRVVPSHPVQLEAFVGADEIVGYGATALKASFASGRVGAQGAASPTGRGIYGGVGVGAALVEGATVKLNYDYSSRDGVATQTARARLGLAF